MAQMPSKGSLSTLKVFEKLTDHTDTCYVCPSCFTKCLLLSNVKNKINFKKGKEIAQEPPSRVFVLMLMSLMCHD